MIQLTTFILAKPVLMRYFVTKEKVIRIVIDNYKTK